MIATESVDQVATRLGCSGRQVFRLLRAGKLERAPRFGKEIRILSASVDLALLGGASKSRRSRQRRVWPEVARLEDLHI